MILFYDTVLQQWVHTIKNETIYLGTDTTPILYKNTVNSSHFIELLLDGNNRILTVGFMTCLHPANLTKINGNIALFTALHHDLAKHGIFSFIFTAEEALKDHASGWVFSSEKDLWIKVTVPSPCVVYNRIPYRTFEKGDIYKAVIKKFKQRKIPFFNPGFIQKDSLYHILKKDQMLSNHLPETIFINSKDALYTFLQIHKEVYLKPVSGNQGSGIMVLSFSEQAGVMINKPRSTTSYEHFDEYWNLSGRQLMLRSYIAQRAIEPKKLNGHRFDYRILVHYEKHHYKISGIAVRMSQTQEITTHIPKGGKLVPYDQLHTSTLDQQIYEIVQRCGAVLSDNLGFFGEFSIDIGEDKKSHLFIYEINAKPMQFDEPEIEASRLENLRNLFIKLGFSKLRDF